MRRDLMSLIIVCLLLMGCGDGIGPEELSGRIVFSQLVSGDGIQIFVMNADGSEVTRLTHGGPYNTSPGWSPDGSKIVFQHGGILAGEIHIMSADGTGETTISGGGLADPDWSPDGLQIAVNGVPISVINAEGTGEWRNLLDADTAAGGEPDWSPDGERIAVYRVVVGEMPDIYVANADGTELTNLTNSPEDEEQPAWSPDGSKIAFFRSPNSIFVMNADGTSQTQLTHEGSSPTWSPDGTKIALQWDGGIYVMNADGSQRTMTYKGENSVFHPDWR